MCLRFYGAYHEARKEGIRVDLPPLMKEFWADGTLHFLVYVRSCHLTSCSSLLTCRISNFGGPFMHHPHERMLNVTSPVAHFVSTMNYYLGQGREFFLAESWVDSWSLPVIYRNWLLSDGYYWLFLSLWDEFHLSLMELTIQSDYPNDHQFTQSLADRFYANPEPVSETYRVCSSALTWGWDLEMPPSRRKYA